jgi:hypothetical protein
VFGMAPYWLSKWSTLLPLIERFAEHEGCNYTKLAWYLNGRRVYETDSPVSVHVPTPTTTQSDKS